MIPAFRSPPPPPKRRFAHPLALPMPHIGNEEKNRLAPVAAIQNLVERSRKFNAGFAGHATGLPKVPAAVHPNSEFHRLTLPLLHRTSISFPVYFPLFFTSSAR